MSPAERNTPSGQDAAIVFATYISKVIFALATQTILAYMLLPEGRGSYALCVAAFAITLGALFKPGAVEGLNISS